MTFLIDASRVVFPPFLCAQSSLMSIQKSVLGSVHEHAFCLAKSLSRHVNGRVNGGAAADHLYGDAGNDTLDGGAGINLLTGGDGEDSFSVRFDDILSTSNDYDVITDFDVTDDTLALPQLVDLGAPIFDASGSRFYDPFGYVDSTGVIQTQPTLVRWVQVDDISELGLETSGSTTNDADIADTVIYHSNKTNQTDDDWVLMVLEDFTGTLTATHFDIA
ncbi:MAG: hypothetical protein ACON4J_03380 [Parvibaculales bacterium]